MRQDNSHNHCPCARPAHVAKSWPPVWWMRVGINSPMSSFRRFQLTLKEFKLHTLYSGILDQINLYIKFTTRWSECTVQVWVQVRFCQSSGNHSRRLFQKTIESLTAKSMAKLLGQRFCTAWAGWGGASINTGCFRVFGSRCWTLPACSKKTFYYSCHSDSVRQPKRFSWFVTFRHDFF